MRRVLNYLVPVVFIITFLAIMAVMMIFNAGDFATDFLFTRNIAILGLYNGLALLIGVLIYLGIWLLIKKKQIKKIPTKKQSIIGLLIIFGAIYLIQMLIVYFGYFFTSWDVSHLLDIANQEVATGEISESNWWLSRYLTVFPNNTMLLTLLVVIKSIPILGGHHVFLLAINTLLVNIAGLLTVLTIWRISHSRKIACFSLCLLAPILLFNPWIMIPYSDTFAVALPIAIIFIYTCKNKKFWHYLLIGFLSWFGFMIKPTVLIVLVAIIIVEILKLLTRKPFFKYLKSNSKRFLVAGGSVIGGVLLAFAINKAGVAMLNIKNYDDVYQVTFTHYLAMGQNSETYGAHNGIDQSDATTYGSDYEWEKFVRRVSERSFTEEATFMAKKLFLTYSDGTFGWGQEGGFFGYIPEKDNILTNALRSVYYDSGSRYPFWVQGMQIVWLAILFGCLFVVRKKNNKIEIIMMAALIGLTIFQLLFETRSRYLFCYLPIFVACGTLGLVHLGQLTKGGMKRWQNRKVVNKTSNKLKNKIIRR